MLMLNVSLWSALGARPAPSGPSVDVTVNAITGDDAGAPGTPAATLAEGMARLSSGETLGLATGSLWREQLGIAHADVAVTATGAGAAPIIDGAGVVAGPWTPHATHADVWSTAWTRETAAPSGTEPLQIYIDGVQPRRAASLADLAGNGGWYVDDRFAGTTTIYVRSATDPAGTGALYEAGARDHNILWHDGDGGSGVTGVALTGPLELTRALGHYGNLAAGEARYDRLLVRDGGLHHAVVDGDATDVICAELRRDFSVSGEGASNAYPFTIYRADPAGLSRTARRVMVINDRPGQGAQGFYAHGSPGEWGAVTLEQCAAVDCSTGIDASAETLTLEGCYVERAARGVSIVRPTTRVSHLMINDPVWTGSGDYMLMGTGGTETRDIHTVIEHCVFYIADASLADFVLRWGRNGSITVRNCAFVFNAGPSVTAAMQISRYGNPGTVSATIENNLLLPRVRRLPGEHQRLHPLQRGERDERELFDHRRQQSLRRQSQRLVAPGVDDLPDLRRLHRRDRDRRGQRLPRPGRLCERGGGDLRRRSGERGLPPQRPQRLRHVRRRLGALHGRPAGALGLECAGRRRRGAAGLAGPAAGAGRPARLHRRPGRVDVLEPSRHLPAPSRAGRQRRTGRHR